MEIRIEKIERELMGNRKVTFSVTDGGDLATMTLTVETSGYYTDDQMIADARHCFHLVCKEAADQSAQWELTEEQLNALSSNSDF